MPIAHLAFDLGASSGRAIVGLLDGSPTKLSLEEVHRFEHLACPTPAGPVWDLTGIWQHLLTGLGKASVWCKENKVELKTVGVDTWGVDWAIVGRSGELLALPHCYRDPQNEAACQRTLEKLGGFEALYERTGIQQLPFNTVFQIAARHEQEPKLFDAAERLLFLPDLFHYWLSGELTTERTIASTSSMLDVRTGEWDKDLIESLGLPTNILGPIVDPGTVLGTLREEVAQSTGASSCIKVIAPPLARHRVGGRRCSLRRKIELGLSLQRNMVATRRRTRPTDQLGRSKKISVDERTRCRRNDSPAKKHRRPLACSGIAARA